MDIEQRTALLEQLGGGASLRRACAALGLDRRKVARDREKCTTFGAAVFDALERGKPRASAEGRRSRRAASQVGQPVEPAALAPVAPAPAEVVEGLPADLVGDADAAAGRSVAWHIAQAEAVFVNTAEPPPLRALMFKLLWDYKVSPVVKAAERAAVREEAGAPTGVGFVRVALPHNSTVPQE